MRLQWVSDIGWLACLHVRFGQDACLRVISERGQGDCNVSFVEIRMLHLCCSCRFFTRYVASVDASSVLLLLRFCHQFHRLRSLACVRDLAVNLRL